jgi:hypothetical protein
MEEILKLISTCKATAWCLKRLNRFHQQAEATASSLEAAIYHLYGAKHAAPPGVAGVNDSGTW